MCRGKPCRINYSTKMLSKLSKLLGSKTSSTPAFLMVKNPLPCWHQIISSLKNSSKFWLDLQDSPQQLVLENELDFDNQTAVILLEKTELAHLDIWPLSYSFSSAWFPKFRIDTTSLSCQGGAKPEGDAGHGYSEAIYHHDLEGNGVEIYCDKPVSESDISDNRQITGVTEELDAHSLVDNLVNIPQGFKIPAQTKIAHVHLSVKDTLKSSKLHQTVFGSGGKMTSSSASWIASGQYHHHLAFNQWVGWYGFRKSLWRSYRSSPTFDQLW